jgi:hypothetical protein
MAYRSIWSDLVQNGARAARTVLGRTLGRPFNPRSTQPVRRRPSGHSPYPGDFTGKVTPVYAPNLDSVPDPGEVVWTWVPFEEDFERGKDRPVLLIGRDEPWLLALMLTSKDHHRDADDEARWGRRWMDVGSGVWDPEGRPSEIRLDRVLRIDSRKVRREGAVLDRNLFNQVAASL